LLKKLREENLVTFPLIQRPAYQNQISIGSVISLPGKYESMMLLETSVSLELTVDIH
jgi:hypothetical protein